MLKEAIFHIMDSNYVYPLDMETLVIRIRAKKNDIKRCLVYYGDRCCNQDPILFKSAELFIEESDELFDYFEIELKTEWKRVCYYFMLSDDSNTLFYTPYGFYSHIEKLNARAKYFQYPYIREKDLVKTPDWVKDAVMYQIFPDSFASSSRSISCKGTSITDEKGVTLSSMLGGTIKGITENIPYFKELGVNCLYLNPIFKANSYHKYDIVNYFEIDPCFGTDEDFRTLVESCHNSGIRIILDGVFNHTSCDFFAFDDAVKNGENSPYKDWYIIHSFPVNKNYPPNYEAFAYVTNMPRTNTANEELAEYFLNVAKYWITEFNIDGWRLDVANEIDNSFWREFRKAVKSVKPDAFIISEIWEDAPRFLQGDQFDSNMNYPLMYACENFFAKGEISVSQFNSQISSLRTKYKKQIQTSLMNFLDTHDVRRFLSECYQGEENLKLASMFLLTYDGVPSIFYGDETGISGRTEIEYRKPMDWTAACDTTPSFKHYKKLINIRNSNVALRRGKIKAEIIDDLNSIYGFSRLHKEQNIFVILNNSPHKREITVNVPSSKESLYDLYNLCTINQIDKNKYSVNIPPYSGAIFEY